MTSESDVRIERGHTVILNGEMVRVSDLSERIQAIEDGEPVRELVVEYFYPPSDYVTGDPVPSHHVNTATFEEFMEMVDDGA